MTITKEICDANKCPLVPPNCQMFFLTPGDCPDKSKDMVEKIYFSPRVQHRESIRTWSHDEDFPISLRRAIGGMREIIAAVALFYWRRWVEPKKTFLEDMRITDRWLEWAKIDPDEDDDEDDEENMPIVFEKPQ